jgi:hypothetical protein
MRSKRTSKMKSKLIAYRMANFMVISLVILGIAQMTASSYALLIDRAQTETNFSSVFVFPKTVNEIAERAKHAAGRANHQKQLAYEALKQSKEAENSKAASGIVNHIEAAVRNARQAAYEAWKYTDKLKIYMQNAQQNGSEDRVLNYINSALLQAESAANSARDSAYDTDSVFKEAEEFIANMIHEEKKREEEEKKKAEEEAKKKVESENDDKSVTEDVYENDSNETL